MMSLKERLVFVSRFLLAYSLALFTCFIMLRFFDFFMLSGKDMKWSTLLFIPLQDFKMVSYYFIVLFIPCFLLLFISKWLTEILFALIFSILLIAHFCLTIYCYYSGTLLGSELFGYSMQDIGTTA